MNWFDWVLIVMAVVFVVEGLRHGLTRSVIGIAATIVGLFMAAWFYGSVAALIQPYVSHASLARVLGFLAIFIGIQLVGALLSWLLNLVWKAALLSWVDRLLGGCFGLVKAALVGIILVMILMAFPRMPIPNVLARSRIAPYLSSAAQVLTQLAPRELKDGFAATYERVRKFWNEQMPSRPMPARDEA